MIGIAAAIEIGLGERLGLGRLARRFAVDENDLQCFVLKGSRSLGKLEVQRQQDGVQRSR